MDTASPLPRPPSPTTPSTPLLFIFLVGILAIVALILVLAAGPSWTLVGVTIGAILVFTGLVLIVAERLLNGEDDDAQGRLG